MTQEEKERRIATARENFRKGYGCCQAVALTYADVLQMSESDIAKVAAGFGGGFARMREVCGCVSGMTMVAGAISPSINPGVQPERKANYALVQELAAAYKAINGSIICREILTGAGCAPTPCDGPEPSLRTPEFYKKRPCEELCGIAAGLLADRLK